MNKLNKYKITLIIICGIFLGFMTCIRIDSQNIQKSKIENKIITKDKKSTIKPTIKSTIKPTIKSTIKPTIKPTIKKNTFDIQLAILRENFENVADIKYKKSIKTIEIIPYDESFMVEAMQAYNRDTWNGLIKNLKEISRQIEDDDILLCLVNNLNKENYILIVNNGYVVYDFINN